MTPRQTVNLFALVFLLVAVSGCASTAVKAPATTGWPAEQSIAIIRTGAINYRDTN